VLAWVCEDHPHASFTSLSWLCSSALLCVSVFWCHLSHFTSLVVVRFWWLPTVSTEMDMQGQCM